MECDPSWDRVEHSRIPRSDARMGKHSKVLRAECNVDAVVCEMSALWKDDLLADHDGGLQNVTVASFEQV